MSPLDSGALLPPAEDEAVLEVQCFAGPRLLRNGEELWPSGAASREQKPMQLLLFLAAHAAEGVDRDKAVEALLADDESADPVGTLRQWRKRVRGLLSRLVPDLPEEPFEDNGRSYRLNPRMVRSDVQRFLQLEGWAKSRAAIIPSLPTKPCSPSTGSSASSSADDLAIGFTLASHWASGSRSSTRSSA